MRPKPGYLQVRALQCDSAHAHRPGNQGFLGKFWNPRARGPRAPVLMRQMGGVLAPEKSPFCSSRAAGWPDGAMS